MSSDSEDDERQCKLYTVKSKGNFTKWKVHSMKFQHWLIFHGFYHSLQLFVFLVCINKHFYFKIISKTYSLPLQVPLDLPFNLMRHPLKERRRRTRTCALCRLISWGSCRYLEKFNPTPSIKKLFLSTIFSCKKTRRRRGRKQRQRRRLTALRSSGTWWTWWKTRWTLRYI